MNIPGTFNNRKNKGNSCFTKQRLLQINFLAVEQVQEKFTEASNPTTDTINEELATWKYLA